MKKSVFLLIVIMVSSMLNLTACGKEIVAEQPAPTTEPAITNTIESPDEGKETPAVEPTAEPEPTEEVVEPEPTIEPEPTEEPEPDIPLPELSVDVEKYFNAKAGFDFYNYGYTAGCKQVLGSTYLENFGYEVNGWLIMVSSSPWRNLRLTKMYSYDNPVFEPGWIIEYPESDDDITMTYNNISRENYPVQSFYDMAYVLEWCKDNPYSEEKPEIFKGRWIQE